MNNIIKYTLIGVLLALGIVNPHSHVYATDFEDGLIKVQKKEWNQALIDFRKSKEKKDDPIIDYMNH